MPLAVVEIALALEHDSGCAEWDFDDCFQINGRAVFCAWTEVPLLQSCFCILIQGFVQALQYANVADGAIAVNYGPQHYHPFNLVTNESRRIGRVHFAYSHRSAHPFKPVSAMLRMK